MRADVSRHHGPCVVATAACPVVPRGQTPAGAGVRIAMSGCARYLPFCSYLIEFARHRDGATVAEIALARHSQPGVLDVKRLHLRLSKAGRGNTSRDGQLQNLRRGEKSFVRQRDCADEAVVLSRGREIAATLASSRKRAPLRSHSETRTEGAERARIRKVQRRQTCRKSFEGWPSPRWRPARRRTNSWRPCQAALAFATWVAIASISAGDRQS